MSGVHGLSRPLLERLFTLDREGGGMIAPPPRKGEELDTCGP